MRVVQTLWTAKKNLLENSFGWIDPETALMSWALSANCLKEHSKELVLYTDSEGAHILIDNVSAYRYTDIAVIPTIRGKGYQETLINDLQFNILSLLETEGADISRTSKTGHIEIYLNIGFRRDSGIGFQNGNAREKFFEI